ncbi:MAG: hypothetical protein M3Z33_13340 [Actinomycetota bacterium]|nr:hypothetical protein [Actinomycetota bacterium]
MLGRKSYTQEELDHAKTADEQQLATGTGVRARLVDRCTFVGSGRIAFG